ncbi:NAD(P)-binding protein [Lizonia empirigonia]|nr:NAD(P)-binding protein [Lizonia empirigonia]
MTKTLTIVVTGSNRGIGQGIIQLLAKTSHPLPLTIYATSRSGKDLGVQASPPNEVRYSKLDISSLSSIKSFFSSVQGADILINNAGINNNHNETPELAEAMCEAFLSTGSGKTAGARIVNVSSTACQLDNYAGSTANRFRSVKDNQDVDALAESYVHAVKAGDTAQKDAGFGSSPKSYQVSKALVNALTIVLAGENQDVAINCCCPGWVDTDMGHQVGKPPKTPEEGARIPVRLAIGALGPAGDLDGGLGKESERVSGRYFANEGVTDRGWGKAREW